MEPGEPECRLTLHRRGFAGRNRGRGCWRRHCYGLFLSADHAEGLFFILKERATAGGAGLFEHLPSLEKILGHDLVVFPFGHTSLSG